MKWETYPATKIGYLVKGETRAEWWHAYITENGTKVIEAYATTREEADRLIKLIAGTVVEKEANKST